MVEFVSSSASAVKDHWNEHARQWSHVGQPLRPGREDVAVASAMAERVAAGLRRPIQALVLGVTPELVTMPWPKQTRLLAVDRCSGMLGGVLPQQSPDATAGLCGDWLRLPLRADSMDLVIGDGCFTVLETVAAYRNLAAEVRRVLGPDGHFVIRLFVRPAVAESVDAIFADLLAGAIGNFHIFKWRLAMALHQQLAVGVRVHDVWQAWHDAGIGAVELSERLSWPLEQIETIEVYRNGSARYTFPMLEEARDLLASEFEELDCHVSNYELGERCPTLRLASRASRPRHLKNLSPMTIIKSFTYAGPNRRSDHTVVEQEVSFALNTTDLPSAEQLQRRLAGLDPRLWLSSAVGQNQVAPQRPIEMLAWLYAHAALALQQAAGHQVGVAGVASGATEDVCRVWFEYEEPGAGQQAGEIAMQAFELLLTAGDSGPSIAGADLASRITEFVNASRDLAMPVDCRAIYNAAVARGVPVIRMDRPPYNPIAGKFRLRPNGLLRLGHGHRQQTVDGTFCVSVSENVFSLVSDRQALFQRLAELSVPMPGHAPVWCQSATKAGRAAGQLGFPVVLRASRRATGKRIATPLQDREAVFTYATAALQRSPGVLVQPFVAGSTFRLLVAGGQLVAVFQQDASDILHRGNPAGVHDSWVALCSKLAQQLNAGLMVVNVVSPDIQADLSSSGSVVIDVELAPHLDRLLAPNDPCLVQAAEAFVDWIYPQPESSRIPLVAVTGTNGKTTTSRMLDAIFTAAGYSTGLACSDGSWVAGQQVSVHEDAWLDGHLVVLDNPGTEAAVLEATRGSAGSTGLGFHRCDVAVCLNVSADHLNDFVGVRTVEELAELKRSILQRADQAVVLNADDEHCLGMIDLQRDSPGLRVGLVSQYQSLDELQVLDNAACAHAVVELVDSQDWLVAYQGQRRTPIIAVADVPLTFSGAAGFNVDNALHAALAALLMGIAPEMIAAGLSRLAASFEAVPGRLSFYDGLPFAVCMDYAHNPAGIQALCEFTTRLKVDGRRILCFSCNNMNSDDFIRQTGAAAAGSFDHYICKNFSQVFDRAVDEGPRLMREGLMAAGVTESAISCVENEAEAVDAALAMGRPGDLVVIVGGKRRAELWRQVLSSQVAVANS
jgi:UDP-N-acetylmuramyl tripeptide synthase/SAM-dependent methyltransferase